MKDLTTLAIESSCDETSIAIVKNAREVLSEVTDSQVPIHTKFGGVVPEIASRNHISNINYVYEKALVDANMKIADIDFISVSNRPGLVGALLVGVSFAKALAFATDKPIVGVHHIRGHICANFIAHKELEPPFICLIISGGHSHIVKVDDYTKFNVLAKTRDDAAGEAFDKVARCLDLGYPGGPKIDKLAKEGNPNAIDFPKAKFENSLDFSFSGIKSAVLNYMNTMKMKNLQVNKADVAASFQKSVVDILSENLIKASDVYGIDKIAIAGGVSANSALRENIEKLAQENGKKFYYPPLSLCTDNGAMIGSSGYFEYLAGNVSDMSMNAYATYDIGKD
ncbi:tRNA (adenosine(37)-N6)-threonylcarbamoyltransferase complex transferase subunit TsaD [Criibacterium bergeronii]|uniref:tRNA N6-adenosine threonylcarbamoyltransferase n=1 Tax=Criibacterium bergeronii TaxID=1871336 RepID=A0A371IN57_9FIRM|nr:tRNA (adenosine(37)-N6)-threonylcarbamoyltransferase complex transferase subunit TsaD [Criibacterium bergeronii]MBS6062523.1 tRNA (adenosine(37)-N6)-threonylcarbamoyltransferase complex transferase subunit TsaD [Peptostreptococcaceae bacterium]RDY21880.1 tRNA (adenosine(37)-N6)-threonylcarbamoyltransferase complex transferase subunit TsaD [Criibacterium bergeronii]